MAQRVKVPGTKSDNLNSIVGTHRMERTDSSNTHIPNKYINYFFSCILPRLMEDVELRQSFVLLRLQ